MTPAFARVVRIKGNNGGVVSLDSSKCTLDLSDSKLTDWNVCLHFKCTGTSSPLEQNTARDVHMQVLVVVLAQYVKAMSFNSGTSIFDAM